MNHRVGPALSFISVLLFPFVAGAQAAPPNYGQGPGRPAAAPTNWYAQPYAQQASPQAYPQQQAQWRPTAAQPYAQQMRGRDANARPPHPGAYRQAIYAAPVYGPPQAPTPASYGYAGYPAYGVQYPAYGYPAPTYATGGQSGPASWRASEAQTTPLVPTTDNRHYVELGMGAFIPTDSGNIAKAGLEASLWAIHGGWVPNSGVYLTLDASTGFDIGCMAKSATDGCKAHLRMHWIGVGAFINTGTPMIASDVPRSWDLMALTGAEVRVWRGMTVKTTVNWFLPSPWGVYAHEKELAEGRVSGATTATVSTAPAQAATEAAATLNPVDGVESVLGNALKHPQVNLMAMWEF